MLLGPTPESGDQENKQSSRFAASAAQVGGRLIADSVSVARRRAMAQGEREAASDVRSWWANIRMDASRLSDWSLGRQPVAGSSV
jgi:hypothetical protein